MKNNPATAGLFYCYNLVMKRIEKTSVKYLIIQAVVTTIVAMIIWPLMDLFICKVISHSEFKYTVSDHVVEPIIFGIVLSLAMWLLDRRAAKKK